MITFFGVRQCIIQRTENNAVTVSEWKSASKLIFIIHVYESPFLLSSPPWTMAHFSLFSLIMASWTLTGTIWPSYWQTPITTKFMCDDVWCVYDTRRIGESISHEAVLQVDQSGRLSHVSFPLIAFIRETDGNVLYRGAIPGHSGAWSSALPTGSRERRRQTPAFGVT